jgi:hypothetical protein
MIDWLTEYESPNHLDVIIFGMLWTFIMTEYVLWRLQWKK